VDALPVVHRGVVYPDLYRVIVGSGEEEVLGRVEFDVFDVLSVGREDTATLEIEVLCGFPDPDSLVSRTGGHKRPIMVPSHAFHFVFMALHVVHQLKFGLSFFEIQESRPVERTGGEGGAVRRPGDLPDRLSVLIFQCGG
jgi:hypothetical protein